MRTSRYEDDVALTRTLAARLRKAELEASKDIHCGHCRYHRGENRTHVSPHSDVRKSKRRGGKRGL